MMLRPSYVANPIGCGFDCGQAILSPGAAKMKWGDMGILNCIYKREHNKPDLHQTNSKLKVPMSGEERFRMFIVSLFV